MRAPLRISRTTSGIALILALAPVGSLAQSASAPKADACGAIVTLETHARTTTRYALAYPAPHATAGDRIALVLLPGGGGRVDLDAMGCARALKGNSLVRSIPLFNQAGFVTALVDAPSDHPGEDGLAGFRITPEHAADLGIVIADVRARTHAPVWVIGTSRGSISAANAAARLSGASAPDGVVLTSALMVGTVGARKPWVADTVFDVPLEAIRVPLLVVGHAEDKCLRSPASQMAAIAARAGAARIQVATVSGGPGGPDASSLLACEGRAPHGFIDQEAEVVAGIARFVRGGSFRALP